MNAGKNKIVFLALGLVLLGGIYLFAKKEDKVITLQDSYMLAPELEVASPVGGVVTKILVRAGDNIQEGTAILTFDIAGVEEALKVAEEKLKSVASIIPAQHIPTLDGKTLGQQLEEERAQEEKLRAFLTELSVELARAELSATRATNLFHQGKGNILEQQEALAKLEATQALSDKTRTDLEVVSHKRASTASLINQLGSGEASAVPLAVRQEAYLTAMKDVQLAYEQLDNSTLRAPIAGQVVEVLAGAGERLEQGIAGVIIKSKSPQSMVYGSLSPEQAQQVSLGDTCTVELADGKAVQGSVVRVGDKRNTQSRTLFSGSNALLSNKAPATFLGTAQPQPPVQNPETTLVPVEIEILAFPNSTLPFAPVVRAKVNLEQGLTICYKELIFACTGKV